MLEALRHEFNARPRPRLEGCSAAAMFHCGPRLKGDRPPRAAFFQSLWEQTWSKVAFMEYPRPRPFAAAWRSAAEAWLQRQARVAVNVQQPTETLNLHCYPFFCDQVASLTQNRHNSVFAGSDD